MTNPQPKLLKAPGDPDECGVLMWVEAPEWWCVYYDEDGEEWHEGPMTVKAMWIGLKQD